MWLLVPYINDNNSELMSTILSYIVEMDYIMIESQNIYGDIMPIAEGKMYLFEKK